MNCLHNYFIYRIAIVQYGILYSSYKTELFIIMLIINNKYDIVPTVHYHGYNL